MSLRLYTITLAGITPLLMHNGQLADPLNEHAKALKKLSSKRNKSDDDHAEMGKAEWLGGLYYDPQMGPYIPSEMLEAMIKAGAKMSKAGKLAEACVVCPEERYPLKYKGPREVAALLSDQRFHDRRTIRVQASRVVRTRPRFNDWSVEFSLSLTPGRLNPEQVKAALDDAGLYVGLGDYRPKFGRFRVEKFEEAKEGKKNLWGQAALVRARSHWVELGPVMRGVIRYGSTGPQGCRCWSSTSSEAGRLERASKSRALELARRGRARCGEVARGAAELGRIWLGRIGIGKDRQGRPFGASALVGASSDAARFGRAKDRASKPGPTR